MSASTKPAFPFTETIERRDGVNIIREHRQHPGMTLRQWYAGKALLMLATLWTMGPQRTISPITIAKEAFEIADAMIEEGEK